MESISEKAGAGPDLKKGRAKWNGRGTGRPDVQTDTLPPHAPEAEQGVLGCVLLAPLACLGQLQEAGFAAEWFYDLRHQVVYHNLERLAATLPEGAALDLILLQQRLKEAGELEQIGG